MIERLNFVLFDKYRFNKNIRWNKQEPDQEEQHGKENYLQQPYHIKFFKLK